jgi:hypothetical protein
VQMLSVILVKVMPPSGFCPVVPLVAVASAVGAAAATRAFSLDVLDLIARHRDMGDEVAQFRRAHEPAREQPDVLRVRERAAGRVRGR